MQVSSGPSFPITNYLAPVSASVSPSAVSSANGTVLKSTGSGPVSSGGLMQLPTSFTLMPGELHEGDTQHANGVGGGLELPQAFSDGE